MSQQELAPATATQEADDDSPMSWFKRQFFTAKIVDNRQTAPRQPLLRNPEKYWETVTIKLDRKSVGSTTHVMLHLDPDRGSFFFKSALWVTPLPVLEGTLSSAIDPGGDWVTIRLETHSLRLNRAELKAAVLRLRSLRNKK